MKVKLLFIAAAGMLAIPCNAAVYAFSNGASTTASGVQTMEGYVFQNGSTSGKAFASGGGISAGPGVVAVGIFSSDDFAGIADSSQLVSMFTNFGGATNSYANAGPLGLRSVMSLSSPSVLVAGSEFAGKNMYFFSGNGTTLQNSTQFLVFKSATLFQVADDSSPTAIGVVFRPGSGTTLFGSEVASVKTTNTDASATAGWQMATAIPEPSALLLGALGALGFLRRRRV